MLAGVSDHADRIKVGRGLDSDIEMGPLISAEQLEPVTGFPASGEREGVRTVTDEEIFGPASGFDRRTAAWNY